jgi:hypothetical protein
LYSYVSNDPLSHADSDGHAGKEYPLSGKYTVRIDKNNPNDMPNVHVSKSGNEVARGRVNADGSITWEGEIGEGIKQEVVNLAKEKGVFEAAVERQKYFNELREAKAKVEGKGGKGTAAKALALLQIIDMYFQAKNAVEFNKYESETGLHIGILGDLEISNIEKATPLINPGSTFVLNGNTYTLGEDHQWYNKYGQESHLYTGKDGKIHDSAFDAT